MHLADDNRLVKMYRYAYKLQRAGKTIDEIKQELTQQGLDSKTVDTIAANINQRYTGVKKRTGKKNMWYGAIWCAGGIVVTIGTFHRGTGYYVIGWGAIVFGTGKFIRGVLQRR